MNGRAGILCNVAGKCVPPLIGYRNISVVGKVIVHEINLVSV